MSQEKNICLECGAFMKAGAVQCDLCGTPIEGVSHLAVDSDARLTDTTDANGFKFCDQCGTKNRFEAKFCNSCGTALHEAFVSSPILEAIPPTVRLGEKEDSATPASSSALNKRTMLLLGIGALVVAALFGITVWSKQNVKETPKQEAGALAKRPVMTAPPLSPEIIAQTKPLLDKIQASSGAEKAKNQRDLAKLYQLNSREDKAGDVMEEVAKVENSLESWAQTGHYYYDWMMSQAEMPALSGDAAKKAIAAYEKGLAIKDDLDVRTDLGAAYYHYSMLELQDKDMSLNPMKAIQSTNAVLSKNPNHIQANFNKGIMLSQIGRLDQAIAQFEKVKSLTKATEPAYQRADEMLKTLKKN